MPKSKKTLVYCSGISINASFASQERGGYARSVRTPQKYLHLSSNKLIRANIAFTFIIGVVWLETSVPARLRLCVDEYFELCL